ncbi:U-box domain-containing protein [Cordyceps militaris CM01]|uniref:U-box domain-containing protein n=1 Tax=Cordyceps militaris (strain CM01) TaxID=983644 RepID=G3JEQ3_CORMM|nr:U-box domain-containing protein [Cordyceps militaris CM01]EGX93012.1 U-box domain-containing protein [Cordyceps militaris CM01]
MQVPTEQIKDLTLSDKDETSHLVTKLKLHSDPKKSLLIASLEPPRQPSIPVHHVPCLIVLVIDVSASMSRPAPVPGDSSSENNGISVLDLVKHTARMIVKAMTEHDCLSIVTFAEDAQLLQPLVYMTAENKMTALNNINGMCHQSKTNLWQGILTGIEQLRGVNSNGQAPAVLVLTDGEPNHMCPDGGYIPNIQRMLPPAITLHTLGFGESIKSGLLLSIAESGLGNYTFISDSGMLGTNFIHAIALRQSTYATEATLQLRYRPETHIKEVMGTSVRSRNAVSFMSSSGHRMMQLDIPLGNLQYGQSRDIVFTNPGSEPTVTVEATVRYKPVLHNSAGNYASTTADPRAKPTMSEANVTYHASRALLCLVLSQLFPLNKQMEHAFSVKRLAWAKECIQKLMERLSKFSDPLNKSLREDLGGQISAALHDWNTFRRWGRHYLLSQLSAYKMQTCNSDKDPGDKDPEPLKYGRDSPLLDACRKRLATLFDTLPSPKPSCWLPPDSQYAKEGSFDMSSYRKSSSSRGSIQKQQVRRETVGGRLIGNGVRRDPRNGQVCSFEQNESRDRDLSRRSAVARHSDCTRSKRVRAKSVLRS